MPFSKRALLLGAAMIAGSAPQAVALEGVVASIKPIHSLVAGVMDGVAAPTLLVRGAGSPHTYSLRPSEAAMLEDAEVVFWVGDEMETFLDGALDTLATEARVVELSQAHDLTLHAYREGGPFETHAHEEADHDHGEHAHDHGDDDAGHDHAEGTFDMHLWLDPENARAMVHEIEEALSERDPGNAQLYAANAEAMGERLDALIAETDSALDAVRGRPFIVFHDAYQYYEQRFELPAAGSITVSPDAMPGAQRLAAIRDRVRELGAVCVFSEPQFEPRLIEVVTEATEARAGVLDPLGASLDDGAELYFDLIAAMTTSFTTCLDDAG